ncbi:YfiT family bacillithiol transferase [Pontibacter korlensis]|uniref:DinB-like domain-containing protein n=1 Tax=Pontibacter korlensis TaxID=400092 RepID=A0A0E3ZH42_9BACT|nr:putative metal-dependent hydrolase [Pontibacter korlensis]AKD05320.1 hypothetical protein PKOR_22500 [Pontibacter korlensis]
MKTLDELKYPIGLYVKPAELTNEILRQSIAEISAFPQRLRSEVEHLSEAQLNTAYRPGGWTIRQVVHHCADSHMNSLIRFKLALTEDKPTIKPYYEDRWAELADSKNMPIAPSLKMLEGIHERWTVLLNALTQEQLKRVFVHPEHGKEFSLEESIGSYAWHCNHHLAHITAAKESNGWK